MSKKPLRRNSLYQPSRRQSIVHARYPSAYQGPMDPLYPSSEKGGRQQIEELLDLLYRQKYVILGVFLLGIALAAVYALPAKALYQATAFVRVEGGAAGRSAQANSVHIAPPDGEAELFARNNRTVQEELLLLQLSSPLSRRVAERLEELAVVPETDAPITVISESGGRTPSTELVAARVARQVRFLPEYGSNNIVRVVATSTSPHEAALIANLFAEEYEHLTQEAGREDAEALRTFLEEQEEARLADLRKAEADLRNYMNQAGTVGLDPTGGQLVSQMAQLRAQRDEYLLDLRMKRSSLESIQKQLASVSNQLPQTVSTDESAEISAAKARVAELEREARVIARRWENERRPPVVDEKLEEIQAEVQTLQQKISDLSQEYVDHAMSVGGVTGGRGIVHAADLRRQIEQEERAIRTIQERIDLVNERLSQYEADYQQIPEASMGFAELERTRIYAERMYQYVAERALELKLAGERRNGYVRVLQSASVPGLPLPTNTSRDLILGAFLGLLAGIGLGLVRDKLDNRIRKPDELIDKGHATIGVIPDMRRLIHEDHNGSSFVEHDGRHLSSSIVTLLSPGSSAAEAYRPLSMRLRLGAPLGDVRTLLVTSSVLGEGKSVTSANLAVTMAKGGRRTLLIDADLRRPYQHVLFGAENDRGLLQYLTGGTELEAPPVFRLAENLYLLPSGGTTENSAELVGSGRMEALLNGLQGQFDFIVVDSPPLMAVTDAAFLAIHCDAAMLVARAGRTKEKELDYSLQVLEGIDARIVGTVLNGFDLSLAYGYKYSYQDVTKYGPYAKYGYTQ